MRRRVGIFGQHKDDHTTGGDSLSTGLSPVFTCCSASSSFPAFQVSRFKLSANCISDALILICMTDVNGVLHKSPFRLVQIVSSDESAKLSTVPSHLAIPPSLEFIHTLLVY